MSFDEEWAQLRMAARDSEVGTQLNQLTDGGQGVDGDLVVTDEELRAIGQDAQTLADDLDENGRLAVEQAREAGQLLRGSLRTGEALIHVADTWETQEGGLRADCASISTHLTSSVAAYVAGEQEIVNQLLHAQQPMLNPDIMGL